MEVHRVNLLFLLIFSPLKYSHMGNGMPMRTARNANNYAKQREFFFKMSARMEENRTTQTEQPQPTVNFSNIWLPKRGNADPTRDRKVDAAATALAAKVNVSTR